MNRRRTNTVHASWLNQIEIYFSIVQRKVLTPNDFKSLNELEHWLLAFQRRRCVRTRIVSGRRGRVIQPNSRFAHP